MAEKKWYVPAKRSKNYVDELKTKVHRPGTVKAGEPLNDKEVCLRMGYLQAQNDHASTYKYKKALSEGKTKKQAKILAKKKLKK